MLPIVTFVGCHPAPAYAGEVKLTSKVCTLFVDGKKYSESYSGEANPKEYTGARIVDGILYYKGSQFTLVTTNFTFVCGY